MKKIMTSLKLLSCLFFLTTATAFSQKYSKIDNAIRNYPTTFASPEKLAEKINQDFKTDEEKVRAIFDWIAFNVRYDLKEYKIIAGGQIAYSWKSEEERIQKEFKFRRDLAAQTLKTKKGVCQGYTALFHTLCDLTGIKCIDIIGTSKTNPAHIGKLPKASDHVWNSVKIGDSWRFIDVTWASGAVDSQSGKFVADFNDGYFFTAPEVFFLNHFPDDKKMLMIDKSEKEFAELPLYYGGYIKADYEIASPDKGIFPIKSDSIPFSVIDLPANSNVSYVFSGDNTIRPTTIRRQGNISAFDVAMNNRARGYLTIYIDNKSIATYKILR
jgi:transglutaminase/protease-like cytokinesis protein 3